MTGTTDVTIWNEAGTYEADITIDNRLRVANSDSENILERILFNQYLLNGANNNMNVDGSVTPVEFSVDSDVTYDIFLTKIIIHIKDNGITLGKFGGLTALTNGFELIAKHDGTNIEIATFYANVGFVYSGDTWEFLDGPFQSPDVDDLFVVHYDLATPLRIKKNSTDELRAVVNDDLTGITEIQVLVRGWKE